MTPDPSAPPERSPLRVCHVIHSLGPGGAEQTLVELASVAASMNLEMSVLSLTRPENQGRARLLQAAGVNVIQLDLAGRWDLRGFSQSVAIVHLLGPDLVHTHLKHADLIGGYVTRRLRLPMVSTLHLIEEAPGLVGRGKRWAAVQTREHSATLTIAVSEALRRWYVDTFPVDGRRVVTVHNGVRDVPAASTDKRSATRRQLGISEDAVVLVMVAVMRAGKGHFQMLEAMRRLPQDLPVHLLLVGDGPLYGALRMQAKGLRAPVTFTGFREDVDQLLNVSDLMVHPTRFDALPTALMEGLRAGLPLIASDVGGIPEIVSPDVGRLVAPDDIAALVRAIVQLGGDPVLRARLGVAARARFESAFDAGAWAERLRAYYDQIVAEGRRVPE